MASAHSHSKRGLLLLNLGSPDEPTREAVTRYLREFLTDPFVIDIPALFRHLLVKGIIAPIRSGRSAANYKKVWTDEGSPLIVNTRNFAEGVKVQMQGGWSVRWAMRYGNPSVADVLRGWDVDRIVLVPLYPQYAESSTRTAIEKTKEEIGKLGWTGQLSVVQDFFADPEFIQPLSAKINLEIDVFKPDHILLSYHGLPERHVKKLYPKHCLQSAECCAHLTEKNRLCYRAQCYATSRALIQNINFNKDRIQTSFQSRLGRDPWIKPYTDNVVEELAHKGVRRLLVSCPAFVADCLETLEEIEMGLKEQFVELGGEDLRLVPALNADSQWVTQFSKMIERRALDLPNL